MCHDILFLFLLDASHTSFPVVTNVPRYIQMSPRRQNCSQLKATMMRGRREKGLKTKSHCPQKSPCPLRSHLSLSYSKQEQAGKVHSSIHSWLQLSARLGSHSLGTIQTPHPPPILLFSFIIYEQGNWVAILALPGAWDMGAGGGWGVCIVPREWLPSLALSCSQE